MALKNLGHVPGERKLVVNMAAGPTSYTPYTEPGAGGGGIEVRMDFKTLPSIFGIVGVWIHGAPTYSYSVGGWAGNIVNVRLGCLGLVSCFSEIPSTTDVSAVSVFVAAMGR